MQCGCVTEKLLYCWKLRKLLCAYSDKVRGYIVETTVKRFFYMFAVYKYGTYTYHGQGTYIICEM